MDGLVKVEVVPPCKPVEADKPVAGPGTPRPVSLQAGGTPREKPTRRSSVISSRGLLLLFLYFHLLLYR